MTCNILDDTLRYRRAPGSLTALAVYSLISIGWTYTVSQLDQAKRPAGPSNIILGVSYTTFFRTPTPLPS